MVPESSPLNATIKSRVDGSLRNQKTGYCLTYDDISFSQLLLDEEQNKATNTKCLPRSMISVKTQGHNYPD